MATIELIGKIKSTSELKKTAGEEGFDVIESADLQESRQCALPRADIILCATDYFSDSDLEEYYKHPAKNSAEWIVISGGQPNMHLDALMAEGVAYHFRYPLNEQHLRSVLNDFFQEIKHKSVTNSHQTVSSNLDQFGLLLGSSAPMQRLYRTLRRSSQTDANVLLLGESGSGKELAARTLHQQSRRSHKKFIPVNCAALSPELIESELFGHDKGAFTGAHKDHAGVFEQCDDGILFLDEITEMPLSLQSKLLRVLEDGEFYRVGSEKRQQSNVRIIAATNRLPKQAIEEGRLREDLYFRLAHIPIRLPPLRERGQDIADLAMHFLAYRNKETSIHKQLSQQALDALYDYPWPGNIRQLKHCIERAHILANNVINISDLSDLSSELPTSEAKPIAPGVSLYDAEKNLILATLAHCQHNKTRAAETLGVSVKTLYNKLERYSQTASH